MKGPESNKFCKLSHSLSFSLWNAFSFYPHANMICLLLSNKLLALTLLKRMLLHWHDSEERPDRGFDPYRL